jgi:hypothetical protein
MEIYDAIMKAADHIERNPALFRFESVYIPGDCGTPGCALGLIGYFLGISEDRAAQECGGTHTVPHIAVQYLKTSWIDLFRHDESSSEFYRRMAELTDTLWKSSADKCAKALRLYAAKYHAPQRTGIPAIIREIFTTPVRVS